MQTVPAHRRGRKPFVSDALFVTAYMEVFRAKGTLYQVAEKCGYKSENGHVAVGIRANALRLRGVLLPYFSNKDGVANALNSIVFGGSVSGS